MEKRRLEKLRRIAFLEMELIIIHKLQDFNREEINRDFISLQAEEEVDLTNLYLELYPEPAKDPMEDVKKRMEAYKKAKSYREPMKDSFFVETIKTICGHRIKDEKTKK